MALLRADAHTLRAVLAAAKPGDRIDLARGYYGDVVIPPADHAEAVTINATQTRARSLMLRGTAGWKWIGGTIDSPLPPTVQPFPRDAVWRNVMIDASKRIEIASATMTGGHTGVLVTRGSRDVVVRGCNFDRLQSDGVNIATAKRVKVIGNLFTDFRPIPPIYDGKTLVKDGTHPDAVMLWSEKDQEPTSDIDIIGNRAYGLMQGISHFWHPNLGRDKVYRVRVHDNELDIGGYWHGIMLENTPESEAVNNRVSAIPGVPVPGRPDLVATPWLRTDPDALRCGNVVNGVAEPACNFRP